jgi:hypothetical protein
MSAKWTWRRKGCRIRCDGRTIATVSTGFIGEDELNERGRLMAAAPLLKDALEDIKNLSPGGPHISAEAGFKAAFLVICQARDIARAALKAAEGETE